LASRLSGTDEVDCLFALRFTGDFLSFAHWRPLKVHSLRLLDHCAFRGRGDMRRMSMPGGRWSSPVRSRRLRVERLSAEDDHPLQVDLEDW